MSAPGKPQALATLDPQSLISQAISSGTPVETIEKLVDLAIRMHEVQAREAYSAALASFQEECPPIIKLEHARIRTRTGPGYEFSYASLDGVMDVAQPVASKHGLSISWRVRSDDKAAFVRCLIRHALGHTEEGDELRIPIELTAEGGSGASPAQRVGIAVMYGKRQTALAALGLAPQKDEDTDGAAPKDQHAARPRPGTWSGADQVNTEGQGQALDDTEVLISQNQQNRLWATLRGSGWGDSKEAQETAMHDLLAARGLNHVRDLPESALEEFARTIKAGPKK